jgi:hypothetical protein
MNRGTTRSMGHEPDEHGASESPLAMLERHHHQTLWVYWTLVLLGFWTILAPFTLGYGTSPVAPSGGREVWLSLDARTTAITWSDVLSGGLLVLFGWRALTPNRPVSLWICCFVGIWMSFAPLAFWAPSAAAYLNGTLVGAVVVALTVLIPGMPNMILFMKMGPPVPPGWSYNPSSWPQRWIMIALGFAGWLVSRALAAYQLGYVDSVWEPFFGDGSRRVLDSAMSHAWPISDAGLGAFAYTFEFLMGFMGSPARWRTMPWMVLLFGILVIPLGLTHVLLVISQPVVVGEWCTLCLLAAAIMLPMIPLEVDEVGAMFQHLVDCRRRRESLWQVFWKGGSPEGCEEDRRSPAVDDLPARPRVVLASSLWGMSLPWTLVISSALGIWLMFAPLLFGIGKPAADAAHLGGALVLTVSIVSMGEIVRLGRFLNVPLGAMIAVAPWLLDGSTDASRIHAAIVGLAVIALALPRGPKRERYGRCDWLVR